MAKKIPLTRGRFAIVDDHWFDYLSQWKWYARVSHDLIYAWRFGPDKKPVHMHRVVLEKKIGRILLADEVCDHTNRNPLDNREENLRIVTRAQNQANRGTAKSNKLGLKNIRKHHGKFRVEVRKDRKMVFDKTFHSLETAILERNKALREFHGEFACVEVVS